MNILLKNDNIPECNETVTAHIILGGSRGFRLGQQSSTSITIEDEGIYGNGTGPVLELLVMPYCTSSVNLLP